MPGKEALYMHKRGAKALTAGWKEGSVYTGRTAELCSGAAAAAEQGTAACILRGMLI